MTDEELKEELHQILLTAWVSRTGFTYIDLSENAVNSIIALFRKSGWSGPDESRVTANKGDFARREIRELLETALTIIKKAMSSGYWSYTNEYQLGKLDIAQSIITLAITQLKD